MRHWHHPFLFFLQHGFFQPSEHTENSCFGVFVPSDIWVFQKTISVAWFFSCIWVTLSFVCLIIFCWKLDTLSFLDPHSCLRRACDCLLVYLFSDLAGLLLSDLPPSQQEACGVTPGRLPRVCTVTLQWQWVSRASGTVPAPLSLLSSSVGVTIRC